MKRLFFGMLASLAVIILLLSSIPRYINNKVAIGSIAFLGLLFIFIFLVIAHKAYEKSMEFIDELTALAIAYILVAVNMFLANNAYSIEWAFVGFLLASVIFYDFRIDSRFMILPGLLLIGYIPFLLIAKKNDLAETIAIYVYYFLVVGVGLQVLEHIKKTDLKLDFENAMKRLFVKVRWSNMLIIFGLATIAAIIANRFINFELWKWTFVYVYAIIIICYFLSNLFIKTSNAATESNESNKPETNKE